MADKKAGAVAGYRFEASAANITIYVLLHLTTPSGSKCRDFPHCFPVQQPITRKQPQKWRCHAKPFPANGSVSRCRLFFVPSALKIYRALGTAGYCKSLHCTSLRHKAVTQIVQELLKNYGYEDFSLEKSLLHLKKRLHGYKCFPHEIGIFLGYPLEDVKGFIDNKGKNCQSCGFWKVYCNAGEKEALFDKYRKCTRIYRQVFEAGRKLPQMTVVM